MTKDELRTELSKSIGFNTLSELGDVQIKRKGKDKDPYYWAFGKIHGLENIAFASTEDLKAATDPISR